MARWVVLESIDNVWEDDLLGKDVLPRAVDGPWYPLALRVEAKQ
jgi:hypothetical protein